MIENLRYSEIFRNMSLEDIEKSIVCAKGIIKKYEKNEIIFNQQDKVTTLYVLIKGSVAICKDSLEGKRHIVTTINENDIFGEVYVFLKETPYNYYAISSADSHILEMPKEFFYKTCSKACEHHSEIIYNMLGILAKKAYFLNNKIQLLTSGSLRQKICKYLIENSVNNNYVKLTMNREKLADFFNVTRPSLSRELIRMKEDNLIEVDRDMIKILDIKQLNEILNK